MIPVRQGRKHFTASGLIENQGQFLMMYHKKLGFWLYPGGHVERDEEPHDAVIREIDEETGIQVDLISNDIASHIPLDIDEASVVELPMPLNILCEKIPETEGQFHWHIDLIYLCRTSDDQRDILSDKNGFKWVNPLEAENLDCPRELPSLMRRAITVLEKNVLPLIQ